ncbi:cytochrome c [Colwellia sp. MB3u-70]|uniref:cytochrome c n=1 Tax=unclassified Colwellia TaxID=196834 RepID=UPI0015F3AFA3|nr:MULTISPECIES: cytochrome c [unclassified Colwellia]MBA6292773.1 cytochrome c [Colwellia sp. MB3u-8]MBA6308143.1 cytochrome c [Colwellia sp. MB3u-70]
MKIFISIALLAILSPAMSYAEDVHKHKEHVKASGVEALSPDLRNLLSEEMKALQDGMMSIIPAYISGNWSEIETTAKKIKNSYILKQSLTESQVKELHSVLPSEFIAKDQRFHYLAGMLEHAAQSKKPELINFYFSEMNESCASCHAVFATHKFPDLKPTEKDGHEH